MDVVTTDVKDKSERSPELPEHVCAAFGVSEQGAVPVTTGSGTGWLLGDVVLSPVVDNALANWSARVRTGLSIDGLDLAEPIRSRDGRHVVDGWRADSALPGRPEGRADESIGWSLRIAEALADVDRPRIVRRPSVRPWSEPDMFAAAEAAAWDGNPEVDLAPGMEDRDTSFSPHRAAALLGAEALVRHRVPVDLPSQLVHGDLARGLLYDGVGRPGLADVVPYFRPVGWSAAVVAVDHLTWGLVDTGVLLRNQRIEAWPQLLLRAAVFRLAIHALHPHASPEALDGLQEMTHHVEDYLRRFA